jgi:hypothetical protein
MHKELINSLAKQARAAALDIPVLVAPITALLAVVAGGTSPRKAHSRRRAQTVDRKKTRTKFFLHRA